MLKKNSPHSNDPSYHIEFDDKVHEWVAVGPKIAGQYILATLRTKNNQIALENGDFFNCVDFFAPKTKTKSTRHLNKERCIGILPLKIREGMVTRR